MDNNVNFEYINLEYITEMAEGDDDFVKEIVTNCLESMGPNIIKLSEAINANDIAAVRFLTHKLKGSFRFVGSVTLGNIMEAIETFADSDTLNISAEMMDEVNRYYRETERELKMLLDSLA